MSIRHIFAKPGEYIKVHRGGGGGGEIFVWLIVAGVIIKILPWLLGAVALYLAYKAYKHFK